MALGTECQTKHWPKHKPMCRPAEGTEAAAASSARAASLGIKTVHRPMPQGAAAGPGAAGAAGGAAGAAAVLASLAAAGTSGGAAAKS